MVKFMINNFPDFIIFAKLWKILGKKGPLALYLLRC